MEKLVERAKGLIEKVSYIVIASITEDGRPWNSPVKAIHDDEYNFIWNSASTAQHSKNINANGKVFIVIFDSTPPEPDPFGVYIEAEAKELKGEELEEAIKVFYEKRGQPPRPSSELLPPSIRRMYKATPKRISVNQFDKSKTPPDWKVEIKLN